MKDSEFVAPQFGVDRRSLEIQQGESLPHWSCLNATYHVTYHLAGCVPQVKRNAWRSEQRALLERIRRDGRNPSRSEINRLRLLYARKIERYLDAGYGLCHLQDPRIAEIVEQSFWHFNRIRYQLFAWCIMPNHVHVLVCPIAGNELPKIIHSWKSYTATAANRVLGRTGRFWQPDAFSHIVRSVRSFEYQLRYIWFNPDQAGLRDWPWRWTSEESNNIEMTF